MSDDGDADRFYRSYTTNTNNNTNWIGWNGVRALYSLDFFAFFLFASLVLYDCNQIDECERVFRMLTYYISTHSMFIILNGQTVNTVGTMCSHKFILATKLCTCEAITIFRNKQNLLCIETFGKYLWGIASCFWCTNDVRYLNVNIFSRWRSNWGISSSFSCRRKKYNIPE